jgi:hypothetical protein
VKLDFLTPSKRITEATVYADAANADWKKQSSAYQIKQ